MLCCLPHTDKWCQKTHQAFKLQTSLVVDQVPSCSVSTRQSITASAPILWQHIQSVFACCLQHADTGHACGLVQVGLSERINAAGGEVPKKVIEAPFVQIPLGVTEDRLVGTVDIEASMKVCQPYSHHSCFLTVTDAAAHVPII